MNTEKVNVTLSSKSSTYTALKKQIAEKAMQSSWYFKLLTILCKYIRLHYIGKEMFL